jgi:hypothetical protein
MRPGNQVPLMYHEQPSQGARAEVAADYSDGKEGDTECAALIPRDFMLRNSGRSLPTKPEQQLGNRRDWALIVAFADFDSWGLMQDALSKAERYRKEAKKYAELAKTASPAFLAQIYRKVAVRYVFMAEALQKGLERHGDAIERADRMISRLRDDAAPQFLADLSAQPARRP